MVSDRLQYTLAKEITRGEIKKEEVREAFFKNDSVGWRKFETEYLNNVDYLSKRRLLITRLSFFAAMCRNDQHMLRELSAELDRCTASLASLKRGDQLQSMLDFYKDDAKAQERVKLIYKDVERAYKESLTNKRLIQRGLANETAQLTTSIERYQKMIEQGDALLLLDILGVL